MPRIVATARLLPGFSRGLIPGRLVTLRGGATPRYGSGAVQGVGAGTGAAGISPFFGFFGGLGRIAFAYASELAGAKGSACAWPSS